MKQKFQFQDLHFILDGVTMSNNFNKFFSNVYCINLSKRTDKKLMCSVQFNEMDMGVEFISAIDGNMLVGKYPDSPLIAGYQGLNETLINIFEDALANNYDSILILEDDVEFEMCAESIFTSNLKHLPKIWDILTLGQKSTRRTPHINGKIFKSRHFVLGHAMGIKHTLFKQIISKLKLMDTPSDLCIASCLLDIDNVKGYCIRPSIAIQRAGISDNQGGWIEQNDID